MEPKQLKTAPLWWLVTINYITSFIGAALVSTFVYLLFFTSAFEILAAIEDEMLQLLVIVGIQLLALWLMTWNAARFLKSRYVLPDPKKVALFTVFVGLGFTLAGMILNYWYMGAGTLPEPLNVGLTLVELALFFFLSKKYLSA
jgi:membrane-associated HD superfamily phosphohydrolase